MPIDSHRHKDTRAHIPSHEEAGYEDANPKVQAGNPTLELPKNPVVTRGQDPELFWLGKYGNDDREDLLRVDIRSLYRYEHIAPETLINNLYRSVETESPQLDLFASPNELFGNALERDELDKVSEYYTHPDGWSNRLIQGDSLITMTSLLEREGMAGAFQMIFLDPPYGISYKSNWQRKINDRTVEDGKDDHLSTEPETIKAFRDTWELGVHTYLSYLRDRLVVAKELLSETGACFVQISDENLHLVRNVMEEVFGSENFIVTILFQKKAYQESKTLAPVGDYFVLFAKNASKLKFRTLFTSNEFDGDVGKYTKIVSPNGETKSSKKLTEKELNGLIQGGWRLMRDDYPLVSQDPPKEPQPFIFEGKKYLPTPGRHWSVKYPEGLTRLAELGRLRATPDRLYAVSYWDDSPVVPLNNIWTKMKGTADRYVVQTTERAIQRCLLMTTDPGDLVLDPTCGSGTTAYVAEQWGRRWITIDTSRIALNIAKTRLMTATFPYYHLYSRVNVAVQHTADGKIKKKITEKPAAEQEDDIRQGFVYEEVPNITFKSLANNEPPETNTLYDKPMEDNKRLRVAGPFTVETLQNFEPLPPEALAQREAQTEDDSAFEQRIFAHLQSAGVKNGLKNEQAVFIRVERLPDAYLHAEGFYMSAQGEQKAYFHIGPKFGTVSRQAVNQAVKACRQRGDADWLIILGFSFESDIQNQSITTSVGSFEVTKVRMNDDLMQEGLLKKDKKAASFVTIGEPDIKLHRINTVEISPAGGGRGVESDQSQAQVEIRGLDIYDPIKDQVKARNVEDIAYWMLDTDYDGSNFVVRQVFFCGGSKDEFKAWRKGLDDLAKQSTKKKAEATLQIEIDDEAFDRLYGFQSHPFPVQPGQQVAVRVVSQFGEESTKVMGV